jgi:hypothetical protein
MGNTGEFFHRWGLNMSEKYKTYLSDIYHNEGIVVKKYG